MLWPVKIVARVFFPRPTKFLRTILLTGAAIGFDQIKKASTTKQRKDYPNGEQKKQTHSPQNDKINIDNRIKNRHIAD